VFNEATESLKYNFTLLCFYIKKAVTSLNYVGAYYLAFIITTVLLFLCALIKFFENKGKFNASVLFYLFLFLGQVAVLLAILVLYVFADGFRHLIAFIIADTIVILCDKKLHKTLKVIFGGLIIATFVFLFVAKIKIPEAYYVPYLESESAERTEFAESKKELEEKMPLVSEVSRDNTVDIVLDNAVSLEAYYLLPAGFGISMCSESYIEENISSLKNKYLLVPAESELNNIAGSNGYTLIFKNERLSLYSR
jgi:hypothetical protein